MKVFEQFKARPSKWQRFRLLFRPLQHMDTHTNRIEYKTLGKAWFFIRQYPLPPRHFNCRCKVIPEA